MRFSPILSKRRILSHITHSLLTLTALIGTPFSSQGQVSVLTHHNDNSRTGANLNETVLNTTNVNVTRFGKLFARDVDGEVYAQPLYYPNLAIPGQGTHNVIFVATMNNSLYAFDADDPAQSTPLWQKNYGTPVPVGDVQSISDISVKVGILSTPVIDPATSTLYFVHRNKNTSDNSYHQYLHAVDITTGNEKFSGPTEIAGTLGGITFNARRSNQRPALTLTNGNIYLAWSSHNDIGPYYGWVMSYNAATLQRNAYFNATADGNMAGIWQSGQGLTVDSDGNLYFMTGNGTFNKNTGGKSLGNSVIKLRPDLTLASWFTPFNVNDLNARDDDLGSAGVLGIPGTNHILGGGKEGKLYLMDRNNLGGFTPGSDNVVQSFHAYNGHLHGTSVYYNGLNGPCIYLWAEYDNLKVFKYVNGQLQVPVAATSVARVPDGMPGAMLSLSANGTTPETALLWTSAPLASNANNAVVEGIFRVYDANTLTNDSQGVPRIRELWNSKQNAARDNIGKFAKFCPPTVANGKVYMASFGTNSAPIGSSGQVVVYGLLPNPGAPAPPVNLIATAGDSRVGLTWEAAAGADSYTVKRATQSGGPYKVLRSVGKQIYTDTNVSNGLKYYYVVTAQNSAGESSNSNEVLAIPQKKATGSLLTTIADAYVRSGTYGNLNFGSDPQLVVKISPPDFTRVTFLKFDLTEIKKFPATAKLRVYGAREGADSSAQDSVYAVANTTWTEAGLTWNNMPALGTKLATTTVRSVAAYYEWDVTAYVQSEYRAGRKTVTLAIAMDSLPADGYRDNFNSKEAGTNPPRLALTSGGESGFLIDFSQGFTGAQGMALNGSSKWNASRLQLNDGGNNQAGSAFYNTPINVTSFRSSFQFQLTNPNADGCAFVIQNNTPAALGATGGGLGYGPDPGNSNANIPNSVCVKFDLYNNNGEGINSTGLFTGGVSPFTPSSDLGGTAIDLHNGHIFRADLSYNGTQLTVQITDTVTGGTVVNNYTVDIPAALGSPNGYVGFSGGTGGLTATQEILTWTFGAY